MTTGLGAGAEEVADIGGALDSGASATAELTDGGAGPVGAVVDACGSVETAAGAADDEAVGGPEGAAASPSFCLAKKAIASGSVSGNNTVSLSRMSFVKKGYQ